MNDSLESRIKSHKRHHRQVSFFRNPFEALYFTVFSFFLATILGGCGGGGGGGQTGPKADISANPMNGRKPLEVELDASASTPGSNPPIKEYAFLSGDGRAYTETEANALDGAFDGKTKFTYPNEGDPEPSVTVKNSAGRTSTASTLVGVGFGDDRTGAMNYVYNKFDAHANWTPNRDAFFQVLDPVKGIFVAFTADVEGYNSGTGKSKYILWDFEGLSQDQRECLTNRKNEGLTEPKIKTVEQEDSPKIIDSKLDIQ